MPAVLNAANEVAVAAFLAEKLPFLGIPRVVEETMAAHAVKPLANLEQVLAVNHWAREFSSDLINNKKLA
jgi:1-deoxy-D-xylulose-5-phosphate reductoisomerase